MNNISVLPRNFNIILEFFYNAKFETEVKFDRFKIDFYNSKLKLAFEYDGIQHYSVIQKIDSEVVASYKEATSYGDLANGPYPPASTIFTEVYETVPWHVQEQREELGK